MTPQRDLTAKESEAERVSSNSAKTVRLRKLRLAQEAAAAAGSLVHLRPCPSFVLDRRWGCAEVAGALLIDERAAGMSSM